MKNTINFNHTPDYLLQYELLNHQDDLFEYYSKLLMLRIDFAYRKDSESFKYADIHQITSDMTLLIEQVKDISSIVGFAWVLEYGEQHRLHIHAAFYINGQRHQKVWSFWKIFAIYGTKLLKVKVMHTTVNQNHIIEFMVSVLLNIPMRRSAAV